MADTQTVESTQAEQTTGPQAGQEAASTQAVEAEKTVSWDKHQKVVSAERNLRERLKKYEEAEAASLSETERAQKELEKAKAERDEVLSEIRLTRIETLAGKYGAVYPDAIANLIPADLTGEKDIDKAIQALRQSKPRLFQQGSADGGQGQHGRPNGQLDMNSIIRARMGRT